MPFTLPVDPDSQSSSLLFPVLTGEGVRVAVIDSGVHPNHPHIGNIAGGVSMGLNGQPCEDSWIDQLGHGTAVMAAIQEKAPDSHCYAVKVFHQSLRTTADALIGAIDWCINQKIAAINLSLGTVNVAHAVRFAEAVARANEAGTLIIAAREANKEKCYPGCLDGVFSVGLDWDCPRNSCRLGGEADGLVFYASGYPRPAPGVPLARNLHGISFAVANVTGFVARAVEAAGTALAPDALVEECRAAEKQIL